MQDRINKLREGFDGLGIDAVLVSNSYNRRYLSQFTGTNGYALISKQKCVFITDFRYAEQAKEQCKGYEIVILEKEIYDTIYKVMQELGIINLGFEENYVTYHQYEQYKTVFKNINLSPIKNLIQKIRIIKDEQEISKIQRAVKIADDAFSYIFEKIKPGVSELEIALELEFFMKKSGASSLSFDTIIASGQRSSMPHGVASSKLIEYGDVVTIDFGCIFEGYCSDMTRTIFVGKVDKKIGKIYEIVLKAQLAALDMLQPDAICKDIDKVAREIISNEGFGNNFGHGLGHSVGLEIHEEPRLSPKDETVLQNGMILTVEPGIYLEGIGGVRIEDIIVIDEKGYRNFVTSSKELIVL